MWIGIPFTDGVVDIDGGVLNGPGADDDDWDGAGKALAPVEGAEGGCGFDDELNEEKIPCKKLPVFLTVELRNVAPVADRDDDGVDPREV